MQVTVFEVWSPSRTDSGFVLPIRPFLPPAKETLRGICHILVGDFCARSQGRNTGPKSYVAYQRRVR